MVDADGDYVVHLEVHPATGAEVSRLPQIVDALIEHGVQPEAVLADKDHASAANRQNLKDEGIGELIRHKGSCITAGRCRGCRSNANGLGKLAKKGSVTVGPVRLAMAGRLEHCHRRLVGAARGGRAGPCGWPASPAPVPLRAGADQLGLD